MSITKILAKNRLARALISPLSLGSRLFGWRSPSVYFPLPQRLVHPLFHAALLSPPNPYTYGVFYPGCISHCINYIPAWQRQFWGSKFILEFVDHPLSALNSLFLRPKPLPSRDSLRYLSSSFEELLSGSCIKHLIFQSLLQRKFAYSLFPSLSSFPSCIAPLPWTDLRHVGSKSTLPRKFTFLYICSDFLAKGAPIVLSAWRRFAMTRNDVSLLMIVDHIPPEFQYLIDQSDVEIIHSPLGMSSGLKRYIYSRSDCLLAIALTDSCIACEGISYGLPVIASNLLNTGSYVSSDNGILLNSPLTFYGPGPADYSSSYQEFRESVVKYFVSGKFLSMEQELVSAMEYISESDVHRSLVEGAAEVYDKKISLSSRNSLVLRAYAACF